MATISTRLTNAGTLLVNGNFDEFTGAPVVDSSLQLWLDAGQTASYSGSGTTWTDLSGNGKNYTLFNSPTYNSVTGGGVITFAGASSQYANASATLYNSTTTNAYTINIWVYPTGAGQIVSVDGQSTPNTSYHYSAIEITGAGLIYFGQWAPSMTTIATSSQSLNAWYNLVITYNGTTATAYVNGVSVGSNTIGWSAPGASTFFALMSQDSTNMSASTAYASGSVGAFMVYNRALTAAEVLINYNALVGRYSLSANTSGAAITRVTTNTVYSTQFDEVSLQAGAISLNGTSQYLTVPGSSDWALGTGDFTIEWFQYMTSQNANPRVFSVGTYSSAAIAVSIEGGTFYVWEASGFRFSFSLTAGGYLNQWIHFAISRVGGTTKVFKNGTQIGSSYADTYNINNSSTVLTIGNESTPSSSSNFAGYISNFRIIKGTGIYTANFTPPQTILSSIANTKILLNTTNAADFIKDNSGNNLTVTNNGTATFTANGPYNRGSTTTAQRRLSDSTLEVYSNFDEFTGAPVVDSSLTMWLDFGQTSSYTGTGATVLDLSPARTANVTLTGSPTFSSTDGGGSEAFNGSTQYGTGAGTPLGLSAYTKSFWVKLTSYTGGNNVVSSAAGGHFSYFSGSNRLLNGHSFWGNFGAFTSVATFNLNTWYHICVTFNTATGMALYINGVLDSTYVSTTTNPTNTPVTGTGQVDIANYGAGNFLTGSIGQVMVYNRALTADEAAQNFNALRRRYNI